MAWKHHQIEDKHQKQVTQAKKEMKISAQAKPRQAVWNMTMAQMRNGTDQPPEEDKTPNGFTCLHPSLIVYQQISWIK